MKDLKIYELFIKKGAIEHKLISVFQWDSYFYF